jgi:hypothetical protein
MGAALLLCLALAAPARATLEADQIVGSSTGLTTFNAGPETITFDFDPEFVGTLRNPTESGHPFRRKAATHSDGKRPLIPTEGGHPFRRKAATC